MPGPFAITTPTNTVTLSSGRDGAASFLVTNSSGRPVRGRALLHWVPDNPAATSWLSLDGAAERDFPIAGTQQYAVKVQVPPGAPAGQMTFRLDVQDVERADDPLEGQTVTLTVPEPVKPRPFPWWVLAVVAVVLGAGAAAFLLLGRGTTVPADLAGQSLVVASQKLTDAGLKPADQTRTEASATVPKDQVVGSDPAGGKKVNKGSPVTLIVSSGPEMVPVPSLSGTEDQVKASLLAARLVYDGTDEAFNPAPAGQVYGLTAGGQPAAAGDKLVSGTRVRLLKSKGPELVTIPANLVDSTFDDRYQELRNLGFTNIDLSRPYNDKPVGRIVSSTPAPGTPVPKGSPLAIAVSSGPCQSTRLILCLKLSDLQLNNTLKFDKSMLQPANP